MRPVEVLSPPHFCSSKCVLYTKALNMGCVEPVVRPGEVERPGKVECHLDPHHFRGDPETGKVLSLAGMEGWCCDS